MLINISKKSRSVPRSGIRKVFDISRKYGDIISFSLGEPDFQTPQHIQEAAFTAIKEGYTHYTPNAGLVDFREVVAEKVKRENRLDTNPDTEIMATPGAMGALFLAIYATIDDGDEVLVTDPGYVNYYSHVSMVGGKTIRVPLYEENKFILKPEDLEEKITPKTKAIILNYPANPTGSTLSENTLKTIGEISLNNRLTIISDEVYERIVYDNANHCSIASLPDMKDHVISIYSLSKTYAMTGWRIGYAVGNENVIKEMTKLQEHISAHPSTISQKAAIAALSQSQDCVRKLVEEYARRREMMYKKLNDIEGITCIKPQGAFYFFANIKDLGMSSEKISMFFIKKSRVAMVPGSEFGPLGEGYLRISYSVSTDKIETGLKRMEEAVKTIKDNR